MDEGYFAGNFEGLKNHWEDGNRAEKFKSGGTRTHAINRVIQRMNVDVHQHSWLDTGTGAGFIQTQIDPDVDPTLFIGLDFSSAMLRSQNQPYGSLVLGSTFSLPFRQASFSVVSNFFSLSDYPTPNTAFNEFSRVLSTTGNLYFVDYAKGDGYWEERKKVHGKIGNDNQPIIGDINLRTLSDGKRLLSSDMRVVHEEIISVETKSDLIKSNFELQNNLVRKFLFLQGYKPKSKDSSS